REFSRPLVACMRTRTCWWPSHKSTWQTRSAGGPRKAGRLSARVGLAEGGQQPLDADVSVDLGRGERRMAEHLLHAAQVRAAFQQVGGRRMAQAVRPGVRNVARGGSIPGRRG